MAGFTDDYGELNATSDVAVLPTVTARREEVSLVSRTELERATFRVGSIPADEMEAWAQLAFLPD